MHREAFIRVLQYLYKIDQIQYLKNWFNYVIYFQVDISTPKLEKSTSSHTLDSISIISEESDSSPKDSTSTSSAIPPMPIRQMKDLTEHTSLDGEEDKFPKGEVKKETATEPKSPELTGFKDTSEKAPADPTQVVLTKEELKNRQLEKVEKEYREKQKLGETSADQQQSRPTSTKDSDSISVSSSGSISKKPTDENKPPTTNKAAGLASLTAELSAVEGEAKAQMKTSEVSFNVINEKKKAFLFVLFQNQFFNF